MHRIRCNGREVDVPEGATVAAAILGAGAQLPGPLCAMGVCMGCRATINGRPHQLACQTPVRDGMEVTTP